LGENISIRNRAVWKEETIVQIPDVDFDIKANYGALSVKRGLGEQPEAGWRNVRSTTLTQYHADRISFLKIDAEGAEAEILEGAAELIRVHKPLMFIEVAHPMSDPATVTAMIAAHGYGIAQRGPNALAIPL
jgi:FkbM family methyltransferase